MTNMPDRRDPRWRDAAWRREQFHRLVAEHGLTRKVVMTHCGITPGTADQWFARAETAQAPGAANLQVLILMSQAGLLK
jgi:hypothetical protein